MAGVKIKLLIPGLRDLRKSPGVRADLLRRGNAIAARADESLSVPGHKVEVFDGQNRARVTVVTESNEAQAAEASRRNLSFAMNAGKG